LNLCSLYPKVINSFRKEKSISDLNVDEIFTQTDTFRDGILNLCKIIQNGFNHFQIERQRTLIKLADEGLGTTLLPYHTLDLKESDKKKLRRTKTSS
jgi:LysR family hydrogen peroxide-inducible transcriptional activator